jgi:hypothetical protein
MKRTDVYSSACDGNELHDLIVGVDPGIAKLGVAAVQVTNDVKPRVRLLAYCSTSPWLTTAQRIAEFGDMAIISYRGLEPATPVHYYMEKQQQRRFKTFRQDMDWVIGGFIGTQCNPVDDIQVVSATRKLTHAMVKYCGLDPDDPENKPPRGADERIKRKKLAVKVATAYMENTGQHEALAAFNAISPKVDQYDVADALLTALVHFIPTEARAPSKGKRKRDSEEQDEPPVKRPRQRARKLKLPEVEHADE